MYHLSDMYQVDPQGSGTSYPLGLALGLDCWELIVGCWLLVAGLGVRVHLTPLGLRLGLAVGS